MKKAVLIGLVGFVLGVVVAGVAMYKMAPGLMILEDTSPFGFEETVKKLEESTKAHHWMVPKVHDLQASMKKSGKDVLPARVYELCQPDHAYRILSADEERIVSAMMPCRVAVYERPDGKTYISRMNSSLMAGMMGGLIAEVMATAAAENEEILSPVLAIR